MKFPSRCRKQSNITQIKCPYCKHTYSIEDETENDYIMVENTKIHYCRKCGWEFINAITRDITYKYS